jgi:solute carrier family 35 protein F5
MSDFISQCADSFGGVLLVSLADSKLPSAPSAPESPSPSPILRRYLGRPLMGDMLALLSAAVYACYIILLKIRIRSESRIDMFLLFGFVGLFIMLTCWPVAVLLHVLGFERFEWPSTRKDVSALLLNVSL